MKKSRCQIVGQRLREFRQARGLSQEAFASICDLHRTYIGAIERGERNITLETLQTIADALGVNALELLKEKEEDV